MCIRKAYVREAESRRQHLKTAVPVLLAHRTVAAVGSEKQLQDHFPVLVKLRCICAYNHLVPRRRGTGSDDTSPFILYHTHTTSAVNRHVRIITKSRHMDPGFPDDLQNVFLIRKFATDAIYYHIFFRHTFPPFSKCDRAKLLLPRQSYSPLCRHRI